MGKLSPADTTKSFPLALASMGISTFIWAAFLGGWLPDPRGAGLVVFLVGGIGMLAFGIMAYREGVAFATTAGIVLAAFWFGSGIFFWFMFGDMKYMAIDTAWIIFAFGIFVGIITLGTLRMKAPLFTLQSVLFFLVFVLLWAYAAFHTGMGVLRIAGILGIASAAINALLLAQRMWEEAA